MPKEKVVAKYEQCVEIEEIIVKLKEKYPDVFAAVIPTEIRAFEITNKQRSPNKPAEISIFGASGVFGVISPVKYILVAYSDDWCNWETNVQIVNVAKAIKRISLDGNGKLNRFDEMNHKSFILTFGLGYEDKQDIPNILTENVNWVL